MSETAPSQIIINSVDFLVKRQNLSQYQFETSTVDASDLEAGKVILKIDKLAFTANNITYAVLGEMLSYWNFFPAAEGWGKIPAWGFATVTHSSQQDIKQGERFYGYFPLASHVVLQPEKINQYGFVDGAAHRIDLHSIYNSYENVQPQNSELEGFQALFRPLFTTAFLIDDFLNNNGFFEAKNIILSSASSKTAFATAFLLAQNRKDRAPYTITGLTNSSNVAFVEGLNCYDEVLPYASAASLKKEAVNYIDFSGSADLRSELHQHFADDMKYSAKVGAADWSHLASDKALAGTQPVTFFAPSQAKKRIEAWGVDGFRQRLGDDWERFVAIVQGWITVNASQGQASVERVYLKMLNGKAQANQGYIVSL